MITPPRGSIEELVDVADDWVNSSGVLTPSLGLPVSLPEMGSLTTGVVTPTLSANVNDWDAGGGNPFTAVSVDTNDGTTRTVTGILAPTAGLAKLLWLRVADGSPGPISITDLDGASAVANRINSPIGPTALLLPPRSACLLQHNGTNWDVLGVWSNTMPPPDEGTSDQSLLSGGAGAAPTWGDRVQLAGQLGGTTAVPDVRGLRTTTGPTLLAMGAVADGEILTRSGSSIVGAPSGGGTEFMHMAPVAAGSATQSHVIFVAPAAGTVTEVHITTRTAVTGDNTNRKNLNIINKGSDGSGSTEIANLDLVTSTDLVAFDETAIGTGLSVSVSEGDVIVVEYELIGSGVAIDDSVYRIVWT